MSNLVSRSKFLDFVLEDAEDFYANKDWMINYFNKFGRVDIQDLFSHCGYIPNNLLVEPTDDDEAEFTPNVDCELEVFKGIKTLSGIIYYSVEKEVEYINGIEETTGMKTITTYTIVNNKLEKFFDIEARNEDNSIEMINDYLIDNGYGDNEYNFELI